LTRFFFKIGHQTATPWRAVKIISVYYLLFQDEDGWRLALWFSVLMNVNLALLNLLPFPV